MKFPARQLYLFFTIFLFTLISVNAQSRHNAINPSDTEGSVISVFASRDDNKTEPIKAENISLYENAIEQKINNFTFDPSPSRIVLLVDNSQTVGASVEALKEATMQFAYEIFDGDQLFVIGYDEKPEIIQEWTDDVKKLETSLGTFRKQGNPYLFDALHATAKEVLEPLMPGTRKTAVVIISDGLDRGSKTNFEKILGELQNDNITVYSLQLPDRTGGAYRRNQPKANKVIQEIVEGTGGRAFPLGEAQTAAKSICDELRKNRYLLSYFPTNSANYDATRVFLLAQDGITIRAKNANPPNIK